MSDIQPRVKKLYYSISEVGSLTNLKPYVLRYWETEFTQLNPPKNRAGNRTYRQKDIEMVLKIKNLLYKKKFTIDGARFNLSKKTNTNKLEEKNFSKKNKELLILLKDKLKGIIDIINK
jgi:DNA-binding transcriptional MerR regulator